ncbi:MAG: GlxA family transcriptional regulator [Janthinobacterium lividum]
MAPCYPSVKTIALVVMSGVQLLDVAGPSDVFACANKLLAADSEGTCQPYHIVLLTATDSQHVTTNAGITLLGTAGIRQWHAPVDTLLVAGSPLATVEVLPAEFFAWLRAKAGSVRRMGSVCAGAFALAKAGILAGRRATTHWALCTHLQAQYPAVQVEHAPFFVRDGHIYTSGGVTSGMDLALALVEEDHGHSLALRVAQQLVLHLRRTGNQAQFHTLWPEIGDAPLLSSLRPWLATHLHAAISVERMAEQVHMSPRNFARVFVKATGLTPARYVEKLRLGAARHYLEETSLGLDQVAAACGLGTAVTLRRVFLKELQLSPRRYRASFQTATPVPDLAVPTGG